MTRHLVISADCHAGLPPEQYRDYLDPQYRETFDAALKTEIEMRRETEKYMLVDELNAEWRDGREQALTGAWDHDRRIEVLDADGIAGEVIFPDGITEHNSPPFGANLGLSPVGVDRELQWAGARSHNRWIAEFCQMAPERRRGVAIVPATWDVDEAVREVRWARQNGLGSIMIPLIWGNHTPYHHPKYDALWATCQDLEVVVHFHSGAADFENYFGTWPLKPGDRPLTGAVGIYVCEAVWAVVRPLTFLIWGGVFERFPRLKVAITEATTTWASGFMQHLDERYEDWHVTAKLGDYKSHLSKKPSEYFRQNIRLGTFFPRKEAEQRHATGLECMMWGSDYPHPEGTWPQTHEMMHDTFQGLPDEETAAMLGNTAAELYQFDVEKLAPLVERIGPEVQSFHTDPKALLDSD